MPPPDLSPLRGVLPPGTINTLEFGRAVRMLGLTVSEESFERSVLRLDKEGPHAHARTLTLTLTLTLARFVLLLDKDGNGVIDLDELIAVIDPTNDLLDEPLTSTSSSRCSRSRSHEWPP